MLKAGLCSYSDILQKKSKNLTRVLRRFTWRRKLKTASSLTFLTRSSNKSCWRNYSRRIRLPQCYDLFSPAPWESVIYLKKKKIPRTLSNHRHAVYKTLTPINCFNVERDLDVVIAYRWGHSGLTNLNKPLNTLTPLAINTNQFNILGGRILQYFTNNLTPTHFFTIYKAWHAQLSRAAFCFLFLKLKYKGKSYKWFRKRRSMVLRFGYSHVVSVRIPNYVFARKTGKMKIMFFGTSLWDIKSLLSSMILWRPMNIYNGRGLRLSRQIVFRKFGKVSAYR